MARTRKRTLYIDRESTYGVDPSATGSTYLWVPALSIGDLADGKQLLETNYMNGRNFKTAPIAGKDGWSFDFEVPLIGMATAAGDGVAPPADDWLDDILMHIFGVQSLVSGEGFAASSTTSSWILDTDVYGIQDIIAAFEAGIPSTGVRTQFGLITSDPASGTYPIAPTADTAPTTAAVAYGHKDYTHDTDGGPTLAVLYQDDDLYYSCLGGRITAGSATFQAGEMIRLKFTISGDTKTLTDLTAKSALPALGNGPAVTPCKGLLSPVWFNGTKIPTKSVTFDFGIQAVEIESTQATNGRAGYESLMGSPSLTIEPLRTDGQLNFKRDVLLGRLLCQMGAGVLSGGVINAVAAHWEEAYASEVSTVDSNGVARQSIKFELSDKSVFTGTTASRAFQMLRV